MRAQPLLLRAAVLTGAIAALLGLAVAPPDAVQGQAQRLMYVHVPAAWTAYLAFAIVAIASVRYLFARTARADAVAAAAAEVGVVCTGVTLLTGTVWGALTWGTWLALDARVITTALMGLLYVIYLSVRALAPQPMRTGVAVLGVAALAVVPVVHFSVVWWRTLHQPPTLMSPSATAPIDTIMLVALLAAVVTFTFGAIWTIRWRSARLLVQGRHAAPARPERRHQGSRVVR